MNTFLTNTKNIRGAFMALAVSIASFATMAADMTDGVIKRVDAANGKLTIKHGYIKNLDMPGMTMVFQLKDKASAGQFVPGDGVRFTVEMNGDKMVITTIEVAK